MEHLTIDQRYKIQISLQDNILSRTQMAKKIGVHKSTVSREIKRNSHESDYDAVKANNRSLHRCQRANYKVKGPLLETIIDRLQQQDSPEQISGRLKKEGQYSVSTESIYLAIYDDKTKGGELYLDLRQSHKKRHKRAATKGRRGIIPNKTMIDERPPEVALKSRLGDYEGDTIIGSNHQGAIVTLTERVTKLLLMEKVVSKTAKAVEEAVIRLLKRSPIPAKTITFDNGTEFTNHENISNALNCQVFFAHPYQSWERGLNENTNGLIRQFIPKKTCFDNVSKNLVKQIENNLNDRPRKTLEFNSPLEFYELHKNKMHCCI